MAKRKSKNKGVAIKIQSWLLNHPWLKLVSLILALVTWYYIRSEITVFGS